MNIKLIRRVMKKFFKTAARTRSSFLFSEERQTPRRVGESFFTKSFLFGNVISHDETKKEKKTLNQSKKKKKKEENLISRFL